MLQKYIDSACAEGAERVAMVTPDEIVFDGRTLLKCMFGCSDWGKGWHRRVFHYTQAGFSNQAAAAPGGRTKLVLRRVAEQ